MSINSPTLIPIAPIRSPIHEIDRTQFGLPALQRKDSLDLSGIAPPWIGWFESVTLRVNALPAIQDTHANRTNYAPLSYPGLLYYETDRTVFYLSSGGNWIYVVGEFSCTQATLPGSLGTNDNGFVALVTDYNHRLKWGGAAWNWAPGDGGNRKIEMFTANPGTGWHQCDGSTVNYLNATGTTGSETLPNLNANPSYLKGGVSYSNVINLAAFPQVPSNTTGAPSATVAVQSGAGTTVATSTHTHSMPAESTTLPGDPINNVTMLAYYRQ